MMDIGTRKSNTLSTLLHSTCLIVNFTWQRRASLTSISIIVVVIIVPSSFRSHGIYTISFGIRYEIGLFSLGVRTTAELMLGSRRRASAAAFLLTQRIPGENRGTFPELRRFRSWESQRFDPGNLLEAIQTAIVLDGDGVVEVLLVRQRCAGRQHPP
nr:hypothetical protein Iba_chr09cCG7870 [Ipomoea batatas]GMD35686.1 hypothetical protein Iba_chr09dCG9270 [Ipomoea batatas]